MAHPVIFLDRDGTINVDHGYVGRIEDWQFQPGATDALKLLQKAGWKLAVVTNQSGVAAGRYTLADVQRLHQFMTNTLRADGVVLDAIAFCPHAADSRCGCRKPSGGMVNMIADQIGAALDLPGSWMIGDKPSDVQFGQALDMQTILLVSRYWQRGSLPVQPTLIADSLLRAAQQIVHR